MKLDKALKKIVPKPTLEWTNTLKNITQMQQYHEKPFQRSNGQTSNIKKFQMLGSLVFAIFALVFVDIRSPDSTTSLEEPDLEIFLTLVSKKSIAETYIENLEQTHMAFLEQ